MGSFVFLGAALAGFIALVAIYRLILWRFSKGRENTERDRADEALRESYQLNAQIIASAQEGLIVIDRDLRYLMWNPKMEEMSGLRAAEVLGKHPLELFPFLRDAGVIQLLERALAGETVSSKDFPFEVARTGFKGWSVQVMGPLRNSLNEIIGVVVSVFDITARVEAETLLRESEARFRTLAEQASDGIFIADANGRYLDVNSAGCEMLGYSRAEVLTLSIADIIAPDEAGRVAPEVRRVQSGHPVKSDWRFRRKDGTIFKGEVNSRRLSDSRVLGVVRDVTDRLKLEEQLRQSQKMQAVGQLAGGVAHDFNNLLTIILTYSDLLIERPGPADPMWGAGIAAIRDAGERAALLIRQLLLFSRKAVLEPKVIDLNEVLQDTSGLLRRLIGENITFTTLPGSEQYRVKADPSQIEQIVMNLSLNARDAMPHGGRLTIETRKTTIDDEMCRMYSDAIPGRFIEILVTDTGCGMTPEIRSHLFEPFFTTKSPGQGTGLGLATVYGIVRQCGGFITVDTAVGCGTTFHVFLPAVDVAMPALTTEMPAPAAARGREAVLLVEDEGPVRRLARTVLETYGYQVLDAGSGDEALRLIEQHPAPIQLLVTDVVMPEMSGRQLANILCTRNQHLRVLFMSGYHDDAEVRHGLREGTHGFLQKPFTPLSLALHVRAVLDAALDRGRI
jgi:PAS domain S-box-containing protein